MSPAELGRQWNTNRRLSNGAVKQDKVWKHQAVLGLKGTRSEHGLSLGSCWVPGFKSHQNDLNVFHVRDVSSESSTVHAFGYTVHKAK